MDAALNVKFGADTTALITGINKVEVTLSALQARLKALQNERLTIVDPQRLEVVNRQIDGITGQIAKLKAQGTESFEAISKKVDGVTESTGGLIKEVNEGYSAIRKLAYILPGIGIAGIFNLAFEAIQSLIEGTNELNEALSKIKSNQGILSEALGGSVGDIAKVQALAAAVENTNLSYKERENALNNLKKINESYFGDLTLEASSLKILADRVQEYSQALIQEAVIKGFTEEISKQTIEYNKQSDALAILKNNLDKAVSNQERFKNVSGASTGAALRVAVQGANDEFVKQRDIVEKLGTAIAGYRGKIEEAIASQLKLRPLQQDTGAGGVIDTLSKTQEALKEIIKLQDELAKPNTQPLFERLAKSLDPTQSQLLENEIAKTLRDNVTNGIDKAITGKEVGLLREKLRRLLNPDLTTKIDTRVEVNPIVEGDVTTFEKTFPPKLYELLGKLPPIKTDIKVDPNLVLSETEFAKANTKIKETIGQAGVNIAEGLAADFGKAFAGVKNPFGNIAELLGQGLEEIGKQLIIVGGLSQLIQKLLPTVFTPAGAITSIVVGGLAIAAGAALKAISSTKGVKAFAEGGIVTGPTNALIGEAGPEVVFPLDKLNRFIKGNTQNSRVEVVGQTIISGPNLITVLKRAQTNQGMV